MPVLAYSTIPFGPDSASGEVFRVTDGLIEVSAYARSTLLMASGSTGRLDRSHLGLVVDLMTRAVADPELAALERTISTHGTVFIRTL